MFTAHSLNGNSLPLKTLCFTFDDGPGKHTLDIAKYLFEEGVPATFFVVGKYAINHPDILSSLVNWNHTVGNHTFDHPDIPYYVSVNGNIQEQIIRTETVLPVKPDDTIYFRAPYGKWSPEVAAELNTNLLSSLNYVGPIHWEVGGIDCWYWLQGKSVEDAVDIYIADIEKAGKGIVVFHDEIADMEFLKPANKTYELLKQLVPKLKALGYNFVSIDQIETLKDAAKESLKFQLALGQRKALTLSNDRSFQLTNSGSSFNMQKKGNGQVSLLLENSFLTLSTSQIVTLTSAPDEAAIFDYIPVRNNRFMLRSHTGNYLAIDKNNGSLSANAQFMRSAAIFNYIPIGTQANTKISLKERMLLIKKGIRFVKSKLLS